MDALTEYLQGAYGEQRAAIDDLRGAGLQTLVAHARPDGTWPRDALAADAVRDATVAAALGRASSPSAVAAL